jgi:hypothetical protein
MTVGLYSAIYIRLWHSDYGRREFSMNAVVVERNGTTDQLSLIQVPQLNLIFNPAAGFEGTPNHKPANLLELPLMLADSRR